MFCLCFCLFVCLFVCLWLGVCYLNDDQNGDEEVEDYLRAFDNNKGQNGGGPTFESLDEQISHEEIKRCIKQLSRNKSPGKDDLLNEYFMESIDLLIEPLGILFNDILDSGYFPSQWTEGIIYRYIKRVHTTIQKMTGE